ncbi:hypothetical protein D3C86_2143970 [compost metagenome]
MLYTVTDVRKSMQTIMTVLQEHDLENKVLVARRVLLGKDDWFYDVIYPANYSGHFNSM